MNEIENLQLVEKALNEGVKEFTSKFLNSHNIESEYVGNNINNQSILYIPQLNRFITVM